MAYPVKVQVLDPSRPGATQIDARRELRQRVRQPLPVLKAVCAATALAFVFLAAGEDLEQAALEFVVIDGCPACPQLLDQGSDNPDVGLLRRVLHHAGHVSRRKNAEKARTRKPSA